LEGSGTSFWRIHCSGPGAGAREIGERIVERMKEYVEVFLKGMVA
jgi:hypothetical protein